MKFYQKFLTLITATVMITSTSYSDDFDILIKNAKIYDGSGNAPYSADVGVKGHVIAAIGNLAGKTAGETINAEGLSLSPGFIDLHSHADRRLLELPLAPNMVQQGVTTMLSGNCGGSPLDTADFLEKAEALGLGANIAVLIGHNTVRRSVMGDVNRFATDDEVTAMKARVETSMAAGAYGLSTGLKYLPGTFANTEEVIDLAKSSAKYGGFYTSHMREEGQDLLPSIKELITIGEKAQIPVHISHHKTVGTLSWGQSVQSLALVDQVRSKGMDITLDQYPYTASSSGLTIIFPKWSLEGGKEELSRKLADPVSRQKIKDGIIHLIKTDRGGNDPNRVQVSTYPPDHSLDGKTLKEILIERGIEVSIENAAELLMDLQAAGGGRGIYHAMEKGDVNRIMQHELTSIASDGANAVIGEGNPHPRYYGTFPRVLGKYVREDGLLDLATAVRKMTGLPAARMGLKDRGLIKQGYVADIVLFNPETVIDNATFTAPHQHATGIDYVIINGKVAKNPDSLTNVASGVALRHGK